MIPNIPQSIQDHKNIPQLYKINQNSTTHYTHGNQLWNH